MLCAYGLTGSEYSFITKNDSALIHRRCAGAFGSGLA